MDSPSPRPSTSDPGGSDRNLLFGVLALQMDFVSRDALVQAMNAWALEKSRPLGDILQQQGALGAADRQALDLLVSRHLRRHGDDPQRSLAALRPSEEVQRSLAGVADSDVQATIAGLPTTPPTGGDPASTVSLGTSTSAGSRFQVLRPLAKGGLGEVFVARDTELSREVALKEIQPRHAGHAESRARFLLEAQVTGGLEHPGVVPVYGLGTHPDGRPFYAMRLVRGESLREAIARFHQPKAEGQYSGERVLEFRRLLGRFVEVCNAIEYAHSRGVLHRDLKPSNIMLGPYGETLVVDWGLAKVIGRSETNQGNGETTLRPPSSDSSAETQAGSALGTPAYMSPEQAAGKLDNLGPASDVYSLGATLYHLLTGQAPFEDEDVGKILARVQRGEFLPPRRIRTELPAPLEAVCLKAIALHPSDRYRSARAFADDVEHWLADEPVAAYPEPWTARARRWAARHRTTVTTSTAALAVLAGCLVVATVLLSKANDRERRARRDEQSQRNTVEREAEIARIERHRADMNAQMAADQREEARRQRDQARRHLYAVNMMLARRAWEESRMVQMFAHLKEAEADLRGFEWHYLQALGHQELVELKGHTAEVWGVAFSPDGERLATASGDKTARVWDAGSGQELMILRGHTGPVAGIAFSGDGTRLATSSEDGTVRVWDASSGRKLLSFHAGAVQGFEGCMAFSPDGKRLASNGDGIARIWDAETGKELVTLKGDVGSSIYGVAFSPDGQQLATASFDRTARVWDPRTGRELLACKGHTAEVWSVAFSPDGKRLATASSDKTARIWDAQSGKELLRLGGQTSFHGVAFRPDGKRLAAAGGEGAVRRWDATTGQELPTLRGHTGFIWRVAFSPDGRRLATASADQSVRVWDATSLRESLVLGDDFGELTDLAFSPDGHRVIVASRDRAEFNGRRGPTARVWDIEIGRELFSLGHTDEVRSVAFSPDGKRLATASWGTTRLWDADTGRELLAFSGHKNTVNRVCFSPDGQRLATASDDRTARVWDARSGQTLVTLKGHTGKVRSVVFSPDGRRLATASEDKTARIWDAGTGRCVLTIGGHTNPVARVAFSPDGKRLATASRTPSYPPDASPVPKDFTAHIWDADLGREVLTLRGHTDDVTSVAFSPGGKRLATASEDQTARVWDAESGRELLTLKGHTSWLSSVVFSRDGQRLATASRDGTVAIWDAPATSEAIAQRAATRLVRELFDELFLRELVLAKVRGIPGDQRVREIAVALASAWPVDADDLNGRSWSIVKQPGRPPGEYARALRLAEEACKLKPGDGFILKTLGVAQYRMGNYSEALKTLGRSEKLDSKILQGTMPADVAVLADVAFLAMAHYKLGQKDQARGQLNRLRQLLKQPRPAETSEAMPLVRQAEVFLREAEALIEPPKR